MSAPASAFGDRPWRQPEAQSGRQASSPFDDAAGAATSGPGAGTRITRPVCPPFQSAAPIRHNAYMYAMIRQ
ncbi:hypothetical protein Dda_0576 [Drechslerella dactyloides]|uniref:Uncharacterized protein n=1 Tax=Drechslerella dactyloides TaxID=74499 RepID=A0AAD6NNJ1_DREDA|nr:hypothetical protein Dda_0576 [Drechslerella dactyloides]